MLATKAVREMFVAGMTVDAIFEEFGGEVPKPEIYEALAPLMASPPGYTPSIEAAIKGMYVAGETLEQIAEVYPTRDVLAVFDHDVQLLVKIPSIMHQAFKARCAKYDMTMKEMVSILLDAFLRTDFDHNDQPTPTPTGA